MKMATAATMTTNTKQRPRLKRRTGNLHLVDDQGKQIPEAVLLSVSDRFHARQLQARLERTIKRHEGTPERQSIAIAMLAVEERLVKAFWTIARQPGRRIAPALLGRCGVDYIAERTDLSGYSDAAGGKWDSVAPRPSVPGGKEIDQANEALDWLLFVDEPRRKLLVVGATSKRGDAGRQIAWPRLRQGMPELHGLSATTLKRRYQEALRIIVTELTIAHVGYLG